MRQNMIFFSFIMLAKIGLASTIMNPLDYAINDSKFYSEGDNNSQSGWEGCEQRTELDISCQGTTSILVFGGEMVQRQFVCEYRFSQSEQGFILLSSDCSNLATISQASIQANREETVVAKCDGYSSENQESVDVKAKIVKQAEEYSLIFQLPSQTEKKVSVLDKTGDDLSLFLVYRNINKNIQLNVFVDDIGSMSELVIEGQTYYLTCSLEYE